MSFWLITMVLSLLIASIAVIPLRRNLAVAIPVFLVIALALPAAYFYWGGYAGWMQWKKQQASEQQVKNYLANIKGPDELIEKLKAHLDMRPESAKGWYLLAKLYSAKDHWSEASKAFANAHHLNPDNEDYTVFYARSLWQQNGQQFSPEIVKLLKEVFHKNPNQPDTLAMLAMDAFLKGHYSDAIVYWKKLLTMVPQQSDEADALRKAIAQAEDKIKHKER